MEKPIWNKDQMMENRSKFYTWFQKLDERRETDFLSTFPEYTDFMEKCRKTNLAKNYLISSIHE